MVSLIFTTGAIIAAYCCALFGWGRFVRRLMGMADGSWAVTIALGMALWVSIGGVATHPAALRNFTWEKHCGGPFELLVTA